jgi:hypothetical protein
LKVLGINTKSNYLGLIPAHHSNDKPIDNHLWQVKNQDTEHLVFFNAVLCSTVFLQLAVQGKRELIAIATISKRYRILKFE